MLINLDFVHGLWFWAQNFWKTKVILTEVVSNNMGFWVNISMTPNSVREKRVDIQSVQFSSWCVPSVGGCLNIVKAKRRVNGCFINLYFRNYRKNITLQNIAHESQLPLTGWCFTCFPSGNNSTVFFPLWDKSFPHSLHCWLA